MWCDIGWMNELSTVILRVCDNLDDDVLKSMNWCHQFVFIFSNFSQAHISSSTSSSSSSSNSLYLLHDHENDEMNDNMNVPMMMMKTARRRRRWGSSSIGRGGELTAYLVIFGVLYPQFAEKIVKIPLVSGQIGGRKGGKYGVLGLEHGV